jgi:hypothetical protein
VLPPPVYLVVSGVLFPALPAGVSRDEFFLDVLVELVQVDVAEHGRYHAPNAIDNFCFDVTLSYRRLERPRRAAGDE